MTANQEKPVCVNCDKSTQKELPNDSIASDGMICSEAYHKVSACMDQNKGQIAACAKEWDVFRKCHDNNKSR